jgi:tight adherence protein C
MDFPTIAITLIVFAVLYQGAGFFLESRQGKTSLWPQRTGPLASATTTSLQGLIAIVSQTGINKAILRRKGFREHLELLLMRSGYLFGWKPEDLLFFKELGALFGAFLMWQCGQTQPLLLIGAACLGYMLPEFYVKSRGKIRLAEIQRLLPGLVDLIALALESGLDLLAAIERIIGKMKANALREELQTLIQENRLGTPRKEALEHLAYRAPLPDVESLTSMIIQAEELGTSLATVLRAYAEDMRSRRILRAEEMAGKMPVKILFPMMVFFFPIVFVIIFGPLALNLISSYKLK